MRAVLFLLLCVTLASCNRSRNPLAADADPPPQAPAAPPLAPAPPADIAEMDFRGSFNGAALWGSLEAHAGALSGSCFYEKWGADVSLRGTVDDRGKLVLAELGPSGPVSAIALNQAADGAWSGTWQRAGEAARGPAHIERIVRRAGEPVVVATKRVHESSRALCDWAGGKGEDGKAIAPCDRDARIPFVLGLADRAFQTTLNRTLARAADIRPVSNPAGMGVQVDYEVPLNEGGFVSFAIEGEHREQYAYTVRENEVTGLTVAVDARVIAETAADFVDLKRAHAQLAAVLRSGETNCAVQGGPDDDPLRDLPRGPVAILAPGGLRVLYDACANHVHADAWGVIPFRRLRSALRPGSVFAAAWAARDGG